MAVATDVSMCRRRRCVVGPDPGSGATWLKQSAGTELLQAFDPATPAPAANQNEGVSALSIHSAQTRFRQCSVLSRSIAGKLGRPAAIACISLGASEVAQRCHHGLSAAYIASCAAPPATGLGRSKAGRKLDGQPVRRHAAQSCRLGCSSATGIVSRPALSKTILSATTATPQRLRLRLRHWHLCLPAPPPSAAPAPASCCCPALPH